MKLSYLNFALVFLIGLTVALPFVLDGTVNAQNQNITPRMVINMSDLSIKVDNTTSNETITFSNNTEEQMGNSTSAN
jgi:hypothetical protein